MYILGPYQPSNELMLKFYGYYKQASIGPCDSPKPSFWDVINRAKWDAWHKLGDMSSEDAMRHYVGELKQVCIHKFCIIKILKTTQAFSTLRF